MLDLLGHGTEESRDIAFAVWQRERIEKFHDDIGTVVVDALGEETRKMSVTRDA